MTVLRPLCAVCHRYERAEGSAKCTYCGPGRLGAPPLPPKRSEFDDGDA